MYGQKTNDEEKSIGRKSYQKKEMKNESDVYLGEKN
jgi:hypothetical protein